MTEILFRSAHEALMFAFRYSHDQSPRTPMTRLMQGGSVGSGKGLIGIDGAGQAGLILAALVQLNPEQRAVIWVRYGDVETECPCCGGPARSPEWRNALDMLSHAPELADLPRKIRHGCVEKVVCRRKGMRIGALAAGYEVTERTVQRRMREFKDRIGRVENGAIAMLEEHFIGRELLEAA